MREALPKHVRALAEVLDGREMLEELAPWPGAEVLPEVFRAVKGQAAGSGDHRFAGELDRSAEKIARELTCGAGWVTDDLRQALGVFGDMLVRPELARSPGAVLACTQVAAWAEENGLVVTRFCFAALAGLSEPDDFRRMYSVGLQARDLARWNAARVWLEQAAALASRLGSWDEHVRAVLAVGNMLYRQGLYQQARAVFETALDLARNHSLTELQGGALHDLVMIAGETRDMPAAERYARLALAAYGPGHANVPALAHDLAYLWMNEGYPARALSVLRAVLPHFDSRPRDRIRVLASIAHAAAASGDTALFEESYGQVRESMREPAAAAATASSLLERAYGSCALARWGDAEHLTDAVLEVATSRGEVDVIARADALLKTVAARVGTSGPEVRYPGTRIDEDVALPVRAASEAMAESLIRSVVARDVLRSAEEARLQASAADQSRQEAGKLAAARFAQGPHTAFRRCAWSGRILEYATYRSAVNPHESEAWERVLHVESEGSSSFNRATHRDVAPPHVHDPSVPGGVRAARPEEVPRRPW